MNYNTVGGGNLNLNLSMMMNKVDEKNTANEFVQGCQEMKDSTKPAGTSKGPSRRRRKRGNGICVRRVYKDFASMSKNEFQRDHLYELIGDCPKYKRKIGGSFPERLHSMLTEGTKDYVDPSIMSWLPHGRAFRINKPEEFCQKVLIQTFKHTNLNSFMRQINLYGFYRIHFGPDKGSYYHELFLRDRKHLIEGMLRVKVNGRRNTGCKDPKIEPNFYEMPPVGSEASSVCNHEADPLDKADDLVGCFSNAKKKNTCSKEFQTRGPATKDRNACSSSTLQQDCKGKVLQSLKSAFEKVSKIENPKNSPILKPRGIHKKEKDELVCENFYSVPDIPTSIEVIRYDDRAQGEGRNSIFPMEKKRQALFGSSGVQESKKQDQGLPAEAQICPRVVASREIISHQRESLQDLSSCHGSKNLGGSFVWHLDHMNQCWSRQEVPFLHVETPPTTPPTILSKPVLVSPNDRTCTAGTTSVGKPESWLHASPGDFPHGLQPVSLPTKEGDPSAECLLLPSLNSDLHPNGQEIESLLHEQNADRGSTEIAVDFRKDIFDDDDDRICEAVISSFLPVLPDEEDEDTGNDFDSFCPEMSNILNELDRIDPIPLEISHSSANTSASNLNAMLDDDEESTDSSSIPKYAEKQYRLLEMFHHVKDKVFDP